jgi:capsular polysaccharide biosynthesis protein
LDVADTIFRAETFERRLPGNIAQRDLIYFQPLQQYKCPALTIYRFKSINLLPDGTLFRGLTPLDISFPFYKKRLKHHNSKGILSIRALWKKKTLRSKKNFLVIHDPWTHNYYHWITQALPRLLLTQQMNEPFELLLPEDHQTDFHKTTLKLLQVQNWHVLKRGKQYYNIQNLIYPTHDIQIGDYHDALIQMLAKKISYEAEGSPSKKIFIKRRGQDKRKILNEPEVIHLFNKYGFEIIDFESLSFNEQRQTLAHTKVLAGVHGAGLTNMLFMPSGSYVLELTSQINGEHYYYYSLSNALRHNYYYQACPADDNRVVQEANLMVDCKILEANIVSILSHD